jgi:hypothetical protein
MDIGAYKSPSKDSYESGISLSLIRGGKKKS